MKHDPVIIALRAAAALIGAAGMLTTSLGLAFGSVSLPLAAVSLLAFGLLGAVLVFGD